MGKVVEICKVLEETDQRSDAGWMWNIWSIVRFSRCQISSFAIILGAGVGILGIRLNGPENEWSVVIVLHRISCCPVLLFMKQTYPHICLAVHKPPTTNDDTATRKNDALVCPQIVFLKVIINVLLKVFYEGDALPAGDTMLRGKRIEPAGCEEAVIMIFADAMKLDVRGLLCGFGTGLGASAGWSLITQRTQTLLEKVRPGQASVFHEV